MAECEIPDKLSMISYVSQIYDVFRGEIPHIKHPKMVSKSVNVFCNYFIDFMFIKLDSVYIVLSFFLYQSQQTYFFKNNLEYQRMI